MSLNMEYDYQTLKTFTLNISQIKGFGPKTFKSLFETFSDINDIYNNKDLIFDNYREELISPKLLDILNEKEINFVCAWEDTYPSNLREIADPPIVLYYRGNYNKSKIDKSLSIVGTRNQSFYGKKWTKYFSS